MAGKTKGKCACGNVAYSYKGDPINTAFCYCKECQIHTGTDKYFGVWVSSANFHIEKGAPAIFSRLGDSNKNVNHYFCKDCGTNLYVEITVVNMVSIAASTLDDSANLVPNMAIYTVSAPKWAVLPEGIPHFDRLPPKPVP